MKLPLDRLSLSRLKPLAFSVPRFWQERALDRSDKAITQSVHQLSLGEGLGKSAQPQWVVARSLCVFRCVDLSHVSRADRRASLALKIPQLSPFQEPGHFVVWGAGVAMVWFWDAELQQSLVREQGLAVADAIPETLLQARPRFEGEGPVLQLQACKAGFELQLWQKNILLESLWFSELPSLNQIQVFARQQALTEQTFPEVAPNAWLKSPWGRSAGGTQLDVIEKWLPHAVALIFCLALAWPLGGGFVWRLAVGDLQSQMELLEDEVGPILTSRNNAIFARAQIEQYDQLHSIRQSELFFQLSDLLPVDAQLLHWTYQRGEMQLELRSQKKDPRFYVKALQGVKNFSNVRVQPMTDKNSIQLNFRVSR